MKISSKTYTDNQNKWLLKLMNTELKAVRQAVEKVETKTVEDKASANEFRGQLKDQAQTFVTRRELWSAVVIILGIVAGLLSYFK